ncbi:MAG: GNAT family N-acetyltransferase [Clostridium sp.]|nr:GNAT family N-acetyltransferase [Clostridium sp.]
MIRRAENRDIPKMEDLLRQVNLVHYHGRPDLFKKGTKYSDSQLSEMIGDDTRPIFVAEDENGQVMGYAFCIFEQHTDDMILTDVKTLYIDDLCVDEQIRGQHVGKKLYEYVIDYAKENGCYNVTLNVWSCNEAAMKFYEACGLKPQKVHMEVILDQVQSGFSV